MKAMVIVDIPENENVNDLFAPFNTKVTLDYGSEVIYLEGEVHPIATDSQGDTDVILDTYDNLMRCPHCNQFIGSAHDWTPNFCCECGGVLTGGNGKVDRSEILRRFYGKFICSNEKLWHYN